MNTSVDELSSVQVSVSGAYRNPSMTGNSVSSPSFSDSEPPNYYEATGAQQVIYTTHGSGQNFVSKQPQQQNSIISSDTTTSTYNRSYLNMAYEEPKDYLLWSIFTTVYCFFIGVIALLVSLRVKHLNSKGRYDASFNQSKIARNLNICAVFFGFILATISLFLFFFPLF